MKNGWVVTMKVLQASEDLPCPAFHGLHINIFVLIAISKTGESNKYSTNLSSQLN